VLVRHAQTSSEQPFSFCAFAFVLNPASKAKVLALDNGEQRVRHSLLFLPPLQPPLA
jgi:hypothetical protein